MHSPLWKMPEKGVFTRDFREDLLQNKTDVVIHSYKDLDLEESDGTKIISILDRADPRDILLFKKKFYQEADFQRVKILTSSPRREYNLKKFLHDALPQRLGSKEIFFEPVRGNIQTRLSKWFDSEDFQGIVLAKAALDRLLSENFPESESSEYSAIRSALRSYLKESLFMCLPLSVDPNAPAQGALAAEFRRDDEEVKKIIFQICNQDMDECISEERRILKSFGGGCHQKIGVSIFRKDYGKVKILKGLTDKGRTLDEISLESQRYAKAKSKDDVWPSAKNSFHWERNPIPGVALPEGKDIFVSRGNAWVFGPGFDFRKSNIIWAAGVSTMKELAKKDLWVSGTSDGFGENEFLNLEILLGRKTDFVKLTHKDSESVDSSLERFYTYELTKPEINGDLSNKTHFFWMSGSLFDYAIGKVPEIRNAVHSCGPGITYDHIRKRLGSDSKIEIFLNYEDWKKYHLGEKI